MKGGKPKMVKKTSTTVLKLSRHDLQDAFEVRILKIIGVGKINDGTTLDDIAIEITFEEGDEEE